MIAVSAAIYLSLPSSKMVAGRVWPPRVVAQAHMLQLKQGFERVARSDCGGVQPEKAGSACRRRVQGGINCEVGCLISSVRDDTAACCPSGTANVDGLVPALSSHLSRLRHCL